MTTPSESPAIRRRRRGQSGQSLIPVVGLTSIVGLLVIVTLTYALAGTNQSTRAARADVALQAAEAGVQLYMARLVDDPRYFRRYVDAAEDPRIDAGTGATVDPGDPWPTTNTWSYTGPAQTWMPLQDARFGNVDYNLRVLPDGDAIWVQSTARVMPSGGNNPVVKSVQARVEPLSIADFQVLSDETVRVAFGATTNGKVYSNKHIIHQGTANAPLYARSFVCRSATANLGAEKVCTGSQAGLYPNGAFDSANGFNTLFPSPIDFSFFGKDLSAIADAAQAGASQTPQAGVYKNDPNVRGWMVQFLGSGQVRVAAIPFTSAQLLGVNVTQVSCTVETFTLPAGAPFYMYFAQPAVIGHGNPIGGCPPNPSVRRESVVNGQVTLASSGDIVVGNNITYAGTDDVLGLIARDEFIIARNVPNNLTVRAATIAQEGAWKTDATNVLKGTLTFSGALVSKKEAYASMFATRNYAYDPVLQSIRPPLFPVMEGTWGVSQWREVTPPA